MDDQQTTLLPLGSELEPGTPSLSTETSLKAAVGAFRKHMQFEGFSPHTIQAFTSDLNLFSRYFGAGQPIGRVTTTNVNDFLKWMLEERGVPCSPKTYARRITTLKVFFRWLHRGAVLTVDPAAPVIQHSVRSPLPVILTDGEIKRLLAAGEQVRQGDSQRNPDSRPLLVLMLLLQTGMKKGEVMGLTPNHIDRTDPDQPSIHIRYRSPSKRYKERKVPVSLDWLPVLDEYVQQYDPPDTLITCTPRNLEYILRDLQEMAGVAKAVSFECLRWTWAVHGYLGGEDPGELRQKMGLSEITWRETLARIRRLASSLQ
jgi:site-specific recombinase XerD